MPENGFFDRFRIIDAGRLIALLCKPSCDLTQSATDIQYTPPIGKPAALNRCHNLR